MMYNWGGREGQHTVLHPVLMFCGPVWAPLAKKKGHKNLTRKGKTLDQVKTPENMYNYMCCTSRKLAL